MTGTGTGIETKTGTGMGTRAVMGARTGAGTGTGIERRVEGRDILGNYEVAIEVGRKTRERERRQRVTGDHSHKT